MQDFQTVHWTFKSEIIFILIACFLIYLWLKTFKTFITEVVERRKQIEIEEQEIKWKEKELIATVKLPAEAEAYKVQTVVEGMRQVD